MRPIDGDALLKQWEEAPKILEQSCPDKHVYETAMACIGHVYTGVIRSIKEAPAIDSVAVIRCRNCLNYVEKGNGYGECQFLKCKKSAQGYCDYGIDRI